MVVGLLTFDIHIPESGSLKSKRFVLKSLKDRAHNRFNVSIAEVGDNDLWQRSAMAAAVVANDSAHAHAVLENVISLVRGIHDVELLDYRIEML
ncbi:MAG: DUF503 domain-containing protein [Nitrospirae bacterium]|jgi:hypothetical protein|nr:DUF503 domain-containing protein [Nitrospirota bacterium]